MSHFGQSARQTTLCSELSGARTNALLAAALSRITVAFGFKYFSLLIAPAKNDALLKPLLLETTLPAAFVTEVDRRALLSARPSADMSQKRRVPFVWNCAASGAVQPFSSGMVELLLDYGIPDGVAIPVYLTDGAQLALSFSGNREPLSLDELNELLMIALYAFQAYEVANQSVGTIQSTLSARELEVLYWTSQGKTSCEIGMILSLSNHTINTYLSNATRKLACVNRTQLVAEALRKKLIS